MSDPEELERPEACRNCGASLVGDWCHACGQGHRHVRLSLRALTDEVLEGLGNLDTRLIRTIRMLTRDPGRVCRDYLTCRRVPWMHPFKYALLMATGAFIVQRWLLELAPQAETAAQQRALQFQVDFGLLLNFLFLPLWAVATRLVFSRAGLRWVEHYVVALYGFGHLFLLQTCFAPLTRLGDTVTLVVTVITLLLPVPYLSWLAVGAWGSRWRVALPLVFLCWFGLQALVSVPIALIVAS